MGKAALPVAERLMVDYDHRLRCTGLTILLNVKGAEAIKPTLVEYLNDPYPPKG